MSYRFFPGKSRISQNGGANPCVWVKNLLFDKIFVEDCIKMKEIGPGGCASVASLGFANASTINSDIKANWLKQGYFD